MGLMTFLILCDPPTYLYERILWAAGIKNGPYNWKLSKTSVGGASCVLCKRIHHQETKICSLCVPAALRKAGIASVCKALESSETITRLDLSTTACAPDCAPSIAAMLKSNRSLTALSLASNALGDGGVKLIADAAVSLASHSLTDLDLSNTGCA